MWMPDGNGERVEEQPTIAETFRHVYRFLVEALEGNTAAANATFHKYLAGELPDELLRISRRCVHADQARAVKSEGGLRQRANPADQQTRLPT